MRWFLILLLFAIPPVRADFRLGGLPGLAFDRTGSDSAITGGALRLYGSLTLGKKNFQLGPVLQLEVIKITTQLPETYAGVMIRFGSAAFFEPSLGFFYEPDRGRGLAAYGMFGYAWKKVFFAFQFIYRGILLLDDQPSRIQFSYAPLFGWKL